MILVIGDKRVQAMSIFSSAGFETYIVEESELTFVKNGDSIEIYHRDYKIEADRMISFEPLKFYDIYEFNKIKNINSWKSVRLTNNPLVASTILGRLADKYDVKYEMNKIAYGKSEAIAGHLTLPEDTVAIARHAGENFYLDSQQQLSNFLRLTRDSYSSSVRLSKNKKISEIAVFSNSVPSESLDELSFYTGLLSDLEMQAFSLVYFINEKGEKVFTDLRTYLPYTVLTTHWKKLKNLIEEGQ